MAHDFLHIDILAALLREILMNHRNRENAVDAFFQCFLDFLRLRTSRLNPQQARNRLQIVLNAVMNFLNDR